MFLAVWKFFTGIVQAIVEAIIGFIQWCVRNPKKTALLFAFVFANIGTAIYVHHRTVAKYDKIVQAYKQRAVEREARIKQVEEDSKKAADEADKTLELWKLDAAQIAQDYESKLKEEKKKRKTIVVKDNNKDVDVTIENGEVICRRLSDSYVDTINQLIDRVNGVKK